jgi:4-amino-4-deoxy-L-arabinose transferase-like glycosyltransferase/streptogramin lyase
MKRILLLVVSILLALAAQDNLQRKVMLTDAAILYAAAVVLFICAIRGANRLPDGEDETSNGERPAHPLGGADPNLGPSGADGGPASPTGTRAQPQNALARWSLLAPASALASILVALWAWNRNHFSTSESTYALLVYLAGLAILIYGVFQVGKAEGPAPVSFQRVFTRRAEWLLVAGITAIGAFLALYQVESLPFGVWYDEADSGLEALQVMNGAPYGPTAFHFRYLPSLYFQVLGIVFKVFGAGIPQIRYVTALLCIAAIPALYLLARETLGQRVALVAAFLLAVCRWHFNFGRWGRSDIGATVFGALGFYFLFRALRCRRWSDFAWAGLLIGGGLHMSAAFRLVPVAAAGVAAYWLLVREVAPRVAKRDWSGLALAARGLSLRFAVFLVAALVAFGPLGLFALQNPTEFNQRLEETSVFVRKDTDAQRIAALTSSVQKHLLMFNYQGDPNGRHNLPGEPMLDPTTGAFLVLGIAYAVYRWRDPVPLGLLLWLAVVLQAGILSLEFEAPQSSRALVAAPPVLLLAAWPLGVAWTLVANFVASWTRTGAGRRAAAALTAALICLLLARAGIYNFQTYFGRQANDFAVWNAFSTPETLVAREANALGKGYSYYLANFFGGHPTIRFLAPWLTNYQTVSSDMIFPLYQAGDRPVAIFLDAQKSVAFNAGRRYYASGTFREIRPPFGGAVALYKILLTPEDIRSVQGLNARYYQGVTWQGQPVVQRKEPVLEADWRAAAPVSGPFSAEWTGTLYVPSYGQYLLAFTAPAEAQVLVDETPFLVVGAEGGTAEKAAILAKGNHALRARAVGGAGPVRLAWQPSGGTRQTVPQEALYVPPVVANGLLGSYYRGPDWASAPALQQVDPSLALYFHVTLLPRPYSVEWTGKVNAPVTGIYAFGLESIDDSWLYLDNGAAPVVEAHVGNQLAEAKVSLTAGLHDIRVRLLDKSGYSHINLFWTTPGGSREIIPSERLFPPQGAYPTPMPLVPGQPGATMPLVSQPVATPGAEGRVNPLVFQASWGGVGEAVGEFREPRDIAVDSKGTIYVADTGNRRVQVFNSAGRFQSILSGEFEEPLALVVDSQDNLLVLDSLAGWIYRYDANGIVLGRFAGPAARFYHPRGMSIDAQDNLYVADTGGCRIVKFSPGGEVVLRIGEKGSGIGQFIEIVDVAVDTNGLMYVVDAGNKRIVRLDATGNYIGEWTISPSSPANGPHLALAADGRVLVTDPEAGRLRVYTNGGRLLAEAGRQGAADGEFRLPVGIFVDRGGRVYVVDTFNHRVQILVGE